MGKFSVTSEGQRLVWSREESKLDPIRSLESMEDLNIGVSSQIRFGGTLWRRGEVGRSSRSRESLENGVPDLDLTKAEVMGG